MAKFNLETVSLGDLIDDPEAGAVIAEVIPELPAHPMIAMAKAMPAGNVFAMASGQLGAERVEQLKERLAAL